MSITISEIPNADTFLSGNTITVKATTSGIPSGVTDYMILLKMVNVDNILVGSPFIDGISPDADGVAVFDISGLMDQAIKKEFRWPIPDQWSGKWKGYPTQVYDIQLVPGERYITSDNLLVETWQSVFGTVFIVKGKLNTLELAKLNSLGTTWFNHYCVNGRWFTYMPLTQYVSPYQPVKLWWKSPLTGLTFVIAAKGYYSDGSTRDYFGSPTMYYDVMFEFDVHPAGLDIKPIVGTAKLLYYEVWMEGTPNVEKRTFIVDWTYHEEYLYLLADNQLGGIDCIWLSGAVKYAPTGKRIISYRPFEKGMGVKERTHIVGGNSRARRWIINSGYKTKEEMTALDMLLDTPNAWLLVPPAGGSTDITQYSIIPVTVTSSELQLTDTMNDLESVEIEFTEAY